MTQEDFDAIFRQVETTFAENLAREKQGRMSSKADAEKPSTLSTTTAESRMLSTAAPLVSQERRDRIEADAMKTFAWKISRKKA